MDKKIRELLPTVQDKRKGEEEMPLQSCSDRSTDSLMISSRLRSQALCRDGKRR